MNIPILNNAKHAGDLLNIKEDLNLSNSVDKKGLSIQQIEELINSHHILAYDKKEGEPLLLEDFRKAIIAVVIACRLSSKRLPEKALLKIGTLPLVEYSIKNILTFKNIDHTILATSTTPQDTKLAKHTYSKKVHFFAGNADDVIRRYLDAVAPLNVDIIVRKTADCPYSSSEIFDLLLKEHFIHAADYTVGTTSTIGINSEIMNVKSLQIIKNYFPEANYSEYMTWYFKNNPEFFKLNTVKVPDKFIRNYRLTVDYEEDLNMFRHIQNYFDKNYFEFSIDELFKYLDNHPEITSINSHIQLKFHSDQELINTLNRETKMIK